MGRSRSCSPSPPSSGKKRKKEEQEKREARFVATPSKQVRDRIERAFEHRLYLIDKEPLSEDCCKFVVLGATGNVYTVKLQKQPSCTCPDFGRCHTCKHVLFVMLRVLKLPRNDYRVWQKALLSSELKELLELSAAHDEAVLASVSVRRRFSEIIGKRGEEQDEPKSIQRSIEGDCPVCYEAMAAEYGSPAEPLVFCKSCGNNVHKDCFQRWSNSKSSAARVTCIYCRAPWADNSKTDQHTSGYVNLASYSEHHTEGNTSLEVLYPDSHEWIARRR